MSEIKVSDFLKSIKSEPLKLYRVFDGLNRVQYQYETITHMENNGPCMRTEYVYDGTSSRVVKMKETIDTWVTATMEI